MKTEKLFVLNIRKITCLALCLFLPAFLHVSVFGQRSAGGIPPSISYKISDLQVVSEILPPDLVQAAREDLESPEPYRFGINIPVDLTPDNSGTWMKLDNGMSVWQMTVRSAGAKALSACFDRFHLPDEGELFLYSKDRTRIIGAFTSANNAPHGYFATELLPGDQITLEYVQPSFLVERPVLHLSTLVYAYRGVGSADAGRTPNGTAGPCEVNVNCPEGTHWQMQKKGVVRIAVFKGGGSVWCSGSLINNVRQDHTPYLLTADHCGKDATAEDILQWVFYFNYESQDCSAPVQPPVPKTLTGAVRVAESGFSAFKGSDFYLVVLNDQIPPDYDAFFNGWNRRNFPSPNGVGIHHPQGDIKKISTYSRMLETSSYGTNPDMCFWKVFWDPTLSGHGVTEGGSSGSPIFDSLGRILGTLTGGGSSCDTADLNKADYYGKIYWSWDLNGSDSTRRLSDWLDPDSTGVQFLDGLYVSVHEQEPFSAVKLFPNPVHDLATIQTGAGPGTVLKIEIFDLPGRLVWSETPPVDDKHLACLNLSRLSPGVYVLKVSSGKDIHCLKLLRE